MHLKGCPGEAVDDKTSPIRHIWIKDDIQQGITHLKSTPARQR